MSLPPVVERLRQRVPPNELGQWVATNLFNWERRETVRKLKQFQGLFSRFARELKESAVRLAELPEDAPYWKDAPKSQSFECLLEHFLQAELRQRPTDEGVLWSLAGLAVDRCDSDFGRKYWILLCVQDPSNVRWLVESALWVWYSSGHDTTVGLRETLEQLDRQVRNFHSALRRFAEGTDNHLAPSGQIALEIEQGASVTGWRPYVFERWKGAVAKEPGTTISELPRRDADFYRLASRAEGMIIGRWREATGTDLADHRPEQLRVIDEALNPRFRELATRTEEDYHAHTIAIGWYLGEVIIRNLGGRWHFPSQFQRSLVRTLGPLSRIETYWYVVLGRRKVHVFPAVREAIAKTGNEFSLYEFYKRCAKAAGNA